jgi:hypothetical protein
MVAGAAEGDGGARGEMRSQACFFFFHRLGWDAIKEARKKRNGAFFVVRLGQAHDNDCSLPCVFAQGARQRPFFFLFPPAGGWSVQKITSEVFVVRL